MPQPHVLSKSTYLRGLQCHKALYLDRFHDELRDPLDPATEALFAAGHEVGELARGLFPGGVLVTSSKPPDPVESLERTRALIEGGARVLYEAAFQHDDILAFVDILVRQRGGWRAYEVKSSTSVKEVYLPDAAVQAYVLRGAGLRIGDVSIVHLNPKYVRHGELDLGQLFSIVSVLPLVRALILDVPRMAAEMKKVLRSGTVPAIEIGPHCRDPYDCDFIGHCWAHIPTPSVFDIVRLPESSKFELYRRGIVRIEDIPADFPLGEIPKLQVQLHGTDQTHIDHQAITSFLASLNYPLYFLDLETINPPVPRFDGTRPYGQIPFMYSLHRKAAPTAEPEHHGFLAEPETDPRRPLAKSLLEHIGDTGDVLVYSMGFEGTRVRELAEQLPELRAGLERLHGRLKDLMTIFQQRHYYHPAMHGSHSIKAVLSALAPELGYEDLAISDGRSATLAYEALRREADPDRAQQIRRDLWEYCERDTLAMVRVLEVLEASVHSN